jgi:DNA-binding SARP family transcriptional activator
LFKQLDNCRRSPVIWIAGPAGSGKTTIVASYLESRELPCLWYQIDEGDNDIATFFYYMGLAAKKASRSRRPLPLLTPEYLQDIPTFSKRYFENLCGRLRAPFILVFDNYQQISSASPFHEILETGLSAVPEKFCVLIVSRSEPHPSFARALANNQMRVMGWNDMRLSPEESKQIIRIKAGTRLSGDAVDSILNRTDGWAAGIVLMSEQFKTGAQSSEGTDRFTSEKIFNYFANELFERSDRQTQDFLLKTSFFPKISSFDAMALTGVGKASHILDGLATKCFFTVSRPGAVRIYEYHPLFREFLNFRAQQFFPEPELHDIRKRAADILINSGQIEDAARLLIQSEGWDDMVSLVLAHARHMVSQGRDHTLREWLASLPIAVRERNSWLIYWLGICKMTVDLRESRENLERAFSMFKDRKDVPGIYLSWCGLIDTFIYAWADFVPLDHWISEIEVLLSQYPAFPSPEIEERMAYAVFCALMYRQPEHTDLPLWEKRVREIAQSSADFHLRSIVSSHLILYYTWWIGDPAKVSSLVNSLHDSVRSSEISPLTRIVWSTSAAAHSWMTAEDEKCRSLVEYGLKLADTTGVHVWDFMLMALGCFGTLHAGKLDGADKYLRGMEFILHTTRKADISHYHFHRGWEALSLGNLSHALELMQSALKMGREAGMPFMVAVYLIGGAEVLIELGDFDSAKSCLTEARAIGESMGSRTIRDLSFRVDANYSLRKGDRDDTLNHLRRYFISIREDGILCQLGFRPQTVKLSLMALQAGIETEYVQKFIRKHNLLPDTSGVAIENWPWPYRIRTLGEFTILRDDKPVEYSRKAPKKPLSLLKALIVSGGREVPENNLIDMLWPEADGDLGHLSLKAALHRLRRLLGKPEAIQYKEAALTLDPHCFWVDAWAFQRKVDKVEEIRKAGVKTETQELVRLSEKAMGLYRGTFLENDTDEPWLIEMRGQLRDKFTDLSGRLGGHYEANGEWEKAVETYQRALKADASREYFCARISRCRQWLETNDG